MWILPSARYACMQHGTISVALLLPRHAVLPEHAPLSPYSDTPFRRSKQGRGNTVRRLSVSASPRSIHVDAHQVASTSVTTPFVADKTYGKKAVPPSPPRRGRWQRFLDATQNNLTSHKLCNLRQTHNLTWIQHCNHRQIYGRHYCTKHNVHT